VLQADAQSSSKERFIDSKIPQAFATAEAPRENLLTEESEKLDAAQKEHTYPEIKVIPSDIGFKEATNMHDSAVRRDRKNEVR